MSFTIFTLIILGIIVFAVLSTVFVCASSMCKNEMEKVQNVDELKRLCDKHGQLVAISWILSLVTIGGIIAFLLITYFNMFAV